MVNSKNKYTLSPPVGAVSNRTDLECLINSKIHYKSKIYHKTIHYKEVIPWHDRKLDNPVDEHRFDNAKNVVSREKN